jgi:hypothetical protein
MEKYGENSKEWIESLRKFENFLPTIRKNTQNCAVIIEPRKHSFLPLVIKNFMFYLQENWGLIIFHGDNNEEYVKNTVKEMGEVKLINIGSGNLSKIEYNKLLSSSEFYNELSENILIFQTDTFLRRNIPNEFLDYDYIGAPWFWSNPNYYDGILVGNGGLSFRKKTAMLEIIRKYDKEESMNEDVYFAIGLKKEKLKIPDLKIASEFSVETIYHPNPVGLHNTWIHLMPSYQHFIDLLQTKEI